MNHLGLLGRKATIRRPPTDRLNGSDVERSAPAAAERAMVVVTPVRSVDYAETAAGYVVQATALIYCGDRLPAGSIVELVNGTRYRVLGTSTAAPGLRVYEHKAVEA